MAGLAFYPRRFINRPETETVAYLPFYLDCVLSEDHTSEIEITSHAVEKGFSFSDHSKRKPNSVTVVAAFSEIIKKENQLRNIVQSTKIGSEVISWGEQFGLIQASQPRAKWVTQVMWKALKEFQSEPADDPDNPAVRKGQPGIFDLQTGYELYHNMVLTKLTASQDVSTANALIVTMTFQEISIKSTRTLQTPIEILKSGETKDRAASKVDRGPVAPKPGPQGSSALMKVYGLG